MENRSASELGWKMTSSLAVRHEFELEHDSSVRLELICEKSDVAKKMELIYGRNIARPIDEWHEDIGEVLWWTFPVEEPPYCGSPLDLEWPGYHTHWTPIITPNDPKLADLGEQDEEGGLRHDNNRD